MTEKRIEAAAKALLNYHYPHLPERDATGPMLTVRLNDARVAIQAWLDAGEPLYVNRGCRHQPACDSLERVVTP